MSAYEYARDADPIESQIKRQSAEVIEASAMLRDRLLASFAKWERENGFKKGAGILLVPAGWRAHR